MPERNGRDLGGTEPTGSGYSSGVPTTLYRFYDAGDQLLYVGVTSVGPARWAQHEQHKDWWSRVARSTAEHHPDRPSAMAAERAAIQAESPEFNILHGTARTPRPAIMRGHRQGSLFYRTDRERWVVTSPYPERRTYYFTTRESAERFLELLLALNDPEIRAAAKRLLAE